jgi:RNA polymerase sigma factor (sigma-70 family)
MKHPEWNDSEDWQIWQAMKAGNPAALSVFYTRYFRVLFNYGATFSRDEDLVKDVVQELFLNIWENRQGLVDVRNVRAYLFQALRQNIITKLTRLKRRLVLSKDAALAEPVVSFSSEDILMAEEHSAVKKQQIAAALNTLPARQREALYLRCYNELSYEEIAEVMSINYQSVVNHVHEAIKTLRTSELLRMISRLAWLLLVNNVVNG